MVAIKRPGEEDAGALVAVAKKSRTDLILAEAGGSSSASLVPVVSFFFSFLVLILRLK
jgi:hypothetical protein